MHRSNRPGARRCASRGDAQRHSPPRTTGALSCCLMLYNPHEGAAEGQGTHVGPAMPQKVVVLTAPVCLARRRADLKGARRRWRAWRASADLSIFRLSLVDCRLQIKLFSTYNLQPINRQLLAPARAREPPPRQLGRRRRAAQPMRLVSLVVGAAPPSRPTAYPVRPSIA